MIYPLAVVAWLFFISEVCAETAWLHSLLQMPAEKRRPFVEAARRSTKRRFWRYNSIVIFGLCVLIFGGWVYHIATRPTRPIPDYAFEVLVVLIVGVGLPLFWVSHRIASLYETVGRMEA